MKKKREYPITCDDCGQADTFMQDNGDGSFTCLLCLIKQDDSSDIDREHG